MSRSGYEYDDDGWQWIMWRGRVASAIRGQRGQKLLRELLDALDAMPIKRLHANSFASGTGDYCALGVLGIARGIKIDDLGDAETGCDEDLIANRFGVAAPIVKEIMYWNDESIDDYERVIVEICGPVRSGYPDFGNRQKMLYVRDHNAPMRRWTEMRNWVAQQIGETE